MAYNCGVVQYRFRKVPEVVQLFPNSCYLRAGEIVLLHALVVGVGVVGTCSTRERIKSKASELFVI